MNQSENRFTPIRGSETAINAIPYTNGNIYFTDTGKIFLDKDNKRILMGSSGVSIFYGFDAEPFHDEEDADTLFSLTLSSINDYDQCKVEDLILNEDGCFYRIDSINTSTDKVVCTRLAVSGTGNNEGGQTVTRDVGVSWDSSTIVEGSTYVAGQSYYALFTPTTSVEGDIYCSLTFKIIDNTTSTSSVIVKNNLPKDQVYAFDVSQLPTSNNITIEVTVNSSNSQYNNGLGYTRTIKNIKMVEMSLIKPTSDAYLPLVKSDDLSGTLTLKYMPKGDSSLSLKLHVYIDDIEQNDLQTTVPTSYYNRVVTCPIPRQSHGVHTIDFKLSTELNGTTVYSNTITYEGAWASADDDTPIIWVGSYDTTVINYENSYVSYMVYDPINYRNGLPAEVHLQKGGVDVSQVDATYSDTDWLVWDISNIYEVGNNDFSINCRTTTVNLSVNVTTEGSRDLGLEAESSLLLNINTAGRSSSEIKSQRSIINSTVNNDNINVVLSNFNWQNNGWNDSEGVDSDTGIDSGSFLSIANDASMNINLAGNGLALNQSKNYTFEFRFRVKNVQEYSTLITTIPKYFYSVYNEETAEYEPTYTIDNNGNVTGPSAYQEEIEENGWQIGIDPDYGNILMDEDNTIKQENISSGVVVKWLNDAGYGFCIGTQEAYFKSPASNGIGNVRYCEDEIINLSFVVSTSDRLCYIYLNGILSGAADLPDGVGSSFIINSDFIFNSQYCDFDLYRFRIYELGLTMPQIIHNYLSDMHSITLYDQNQITDPLDDYALSYDLLKYYNEQNPDAVSMPYATWKITDTNESYGEQLPFIKGGKRQASVVFVNPPLDQALADGIIDEWEYYTHCPSFTADTVEIDVQGTSSQKYPRRNYKLKYKSAGETWVYTKGSLAGQAISKAHTVTDKNGIEHTLSKKFHMDAENYGVNKFTWKIDYMESSESYNTGFANLLGNSVHPLYTKHPIEDLNLDINTEQMRTSVYGFPVLVFHEYANGDHEYIGKYNMNLDKSANEAYGYENETEHPYVAQRTKKVLNKTTNLYEDETYQPTIAEIAECWEFKDNKGNWCSFKYPTQTARTKGFMTLKDGTSGESAELEILEHFEYRYSYYADELDSAYEYKTFTDANTQVEYSNHGQINTYLKDKHKNLEALFNWLDSTNVDNATNETLENTVTYSVASTVDNDNSITYTSTGEGVWNAIFTKDTKEYRRQKFRAEFNEHLDKEYCLTYFVLTELLLCYDSRGKNMMLATFGPHSLGGEYIWYPTFYDIDTQLGLNNAGAYLWDYDADVTQDNLFSTPTSVLWNNLYDLFYNEIVQKYRELRGDGSESSVDGSLTYQNIAGAYECNASTFSSYAMQGIRPIIAVGLDEYYKYLAPALTASDFNEGKYYAGYYDTSGAHLYQDGASYIYACQGNKKLTTELLLRNRLNYLDSQWLGGDYRVEKVVNQIFIHGNANHSSTSDLFLDSESLTELPTQARGKGFSLTPYPKAFFDARPGAKIKPFLHQYVVYFHDGNVSIPIKYDGSAGQEDGVWTNVNEGNLTTYKTEPDTSQQIIYIPGGDYISSIGDISLMYPNSLQILHGQKMLDFKLGSDIPGYKNPLINSSSDWELTTMPLLKSVNLCKLSQFNRELNLTGSAKLQEFRALGSIIERINFCAGAPLNTVHLPATMTTVSLISHEDLTNILTSTPIIVEEDAEEGYVYKDAETYKGLYIEGVTDYTSDKASTGHKLSTYNVSGGGLGYHSYTILKNLYDLKYGATSNQYLHISLTDVDWSPYEQIEYGTAYNSNKTYYLLNDHSSFELFTFTNANDWNTKLLNGKIYIYKENYTGTEENTITNLDLLDNFISLYETAVASNQESQFANTSGSTGATLPTLTGTMYVSNSADNLIDEALLTSKYKVKFPNLDIFVKNIQESNLTKYVRVYDSGKTEDLDTERTNGTSPLLPTISAPTQTNYDFLGWSLQNPKEVDDPTIILEYNSSTNSYTATDDWNDLSFTDENNVIILYAIFTIHKFTITFKDQNDTILATQEVPYGSYIPTLTKIPYQNDSALDIDKVYKFLGYSKIKNGTTSSLISEITENNVTKLQIKPTTDLILYALFEESSVYDNPLNEKYLTIDDRSYISVKDNITLSGKITIPSTYNNQPILGINTSGFSSQNMTHIFFANNSQITTIGDSAFASCKRLKYVKLPASVTTLQQKSFNSCSNLFSDATQADIDAFFANITYIGQQCFTNCSKLSGKELNFNVDFNFIGPTAFGSVGTITKIQFGSNSAGCGLTLDNIGVTPFKTVTIPEIWFYSTAANRSDANSIKTALMNGAKGTLKWYLDGTLQE